MATINRIVLLCLLLLFGGCGQSAEEKALEKQIEKETGSGAKVDLTDQGMKITGKTEDGDFTMSAGDETRIPKDFPADVFIYRPSKTVMAMSVPEGYTLSLTTKSDRSQVISSYEREMVGQGWVQMTSMQMGPNSVLVFEKEDRTTSITVASSGKDIQISVAVAKN